MSQALGFFFLWGTHRANPRAQWAQSVSAPPPAPPKQHGALASLGRLLHPLYPAASLTQSSHLLLPHPGAPGLASGAGQHPSGLSPGACLSRGLGRVHGQGQLALRLRSWSHLGD